MKRKRVISALLLSLIMPSVSMGQADPLGNPNGSRWKRDIPVAEPVFPQPIGSEGAGRNLRFDFNRPINIPDGLFENPFDQEVEGNKANCDELNGPEGALLHRRVVVDGREYITCYGWDDYGYPEKEIDPLQFITEYDFDLLGRGNTATDSLDVTRQSFYNNNSELYRYAEPVVESPNPQLPAEKVTEWSYNTIGDVTVEDILGEEGDREKFYYDDDFQLRAYVGPDGVLGIHLDYAGLSRIDSFGIGEMDEEGNVGHATLGRTQFHYNDKGQLGVVTDGESRTTRFRYDPHGYRNKTIYADNTRVFYQHDGLGRLDWMEIRDRRADPVQRVNVAYDDLGRVAETVQTKAGNPDVWKTSRVYTVVPDADGNITEESLTVEKYLNDRLYETVTKTYDGLDRPKSIVKAHGGTIRYRYDDAGRLDRVEHEEDGLAMRYQYDALGRVRLVGDGLSNVTRYDYDSLDQLVRLTPAAGPATDYHYDINGRLIKEETTVQFPGMETHRVHYRYDEAGRFQQKGFGQNLEGLPNPKRHYERSSGLLTRTSVGDDIKEEVTERDLTGLVKQWRDAVGRQIRIEYDSRRRPKEVRVTKEGETPFFRVWLYDEADQLTAVAESVEVSPLGFTEVTRGEVRDRNHRIRDNLKQGLLPGYDPRLLSVVRFQYDAAGHIVEEKRWLNGRWLTTRVDYSAIDGAGLTKTIVYPSRFQLQREYDLDGRLISARGVTPGGGLAGNVSYRYKGNSQRLEKIDFEGTVEDRFRFDADGRITQLKVMGMDDNGEEFEIGHIDYKYSPNHSLVVRKEKIWSSGGRRRSIKAYLFGDDDLGRPAWWSAVGARTADGIRNNTVPRQWNNNTVERFFYNQRNDLTIISTLDPTGDLTGEVIRGQSRVFSLRADGSPLEIRSAPCIREANGEEGMCDREGRVVEIALNPDSMGRVQANIVDGRPHRLFVYDLLGRLAAVHAPETDHQVLYRYDGLDRLLHRIVKEGDQILKEEEFIWAEGGIIEVRTILQRDFSGKPSETVTQFLLGLDGEDVLATISEARLLYHHVHPDGSTFLLTGGTDAVQWFTYSPFGGLVVKEWAGRRVQIKAKDEVQTVRLFEGGYFDPWTHYNYQPGGWFDPSLLIDFTHESPLLE